MPTVLESVIFAMMFALMSVAMVTAGIEVETLPAEALPEGTATIPWFEEGNEAWKQGPCFFSVADKETGMSGQGWLAGTAEHLLIRLVTVDAHHLPPAMETPWAGDGIELCIDARGDGTCGLPKDSPGTHGPDDVKYMLALTDDGPFVRRTVAGGGKESGPLPEGVLQAKRNEKTGETVYELRLPWQEFDTPPGLYGTLGIAVQFNDLDPDDKEKRVLKWGEGTFGPYRPGLFNLVGAPVPTGNCSAMAVDANVLWEPGDAGSVLVATRSIGAETDLIVKLGETEHMERLPSTNTLVRFRVDLRPESRSALDLPFSILLRKPGGDGVPKEEHGRLEIPEAVFRALDARLGELIAAGGHPLFLRHLRSVRALVRSEWARVDLYRADNPQDAESTRLMLGQMLDGLSGDAAEWQTYLEGRRHLIFSYVSPKDRSVQYYRCALPRDWEPDGVYPLFFELHGSGDPNPLAGVTSQLGLLEEDKLAEGAPRTFASMQRNGYYCQPFGRGNLGYREIGEVDVWEAYDDVHGNFRIDQDRRYLYGFSMGGAGTWSIGVRAPDRWAAMAIMAGGLWSEAPSRGLGRNIAHLPIFVWCGERDRLFPFVAKFREEIERYGGKPVVKTTPDLAHNYRPDVQEEMIDWIQQYIRKRPDKFAFVADTDKHLGAWGITMLRDLTISGLPSFTCRIEGNTVRIDSVGTAGLEVKAGEDGLGLDGDVTVFWNGAKSYEGPAETIELGQPQPQRRRRR